MLHNSPAPLTIRSVEVILPPAWRPAACQPDRQLLTTRAALPAPHLRLRRQGTQPQAVQPRGCSLLGLGVDLPFSILQNNNNSSTSALMLAEQLINSKFGVFSEMIESIQLSPDLSEDDNTMLLAEEAGYRKFIPTRQNILCGERSPRDVVLHSMPSGEHKGNYTAPEFHYVVQGGSHYVLVLDQSSTMDSRWTNIKRSFFRFISLLEEGTILSIITFGSEGSLVLPPTVVTENNREGLHGRIPRRVEEAELACLDCGLRLARDVLDGTSGSIVLLTRNLSGPSLVHLTQERMDMNTILYPARNERVENGTMYSVVEKGEISTLTQLNEIMLDIINRAGGPTVAKLHTSEHMSYEFSGTFVVEENLRNDLTITLSIEDEEKVEFFEVIDPSGQKNIFSKFEDGMVLLRFGGQSEAGIWTFHAKLYPEVSLPAQRMTVDVVGQGRSDAVRVRGLPTPSLESLRALEIVALVEMGESPVLGAEVRALVRGPDTEVAIVLKDTGSGYPDIRKGDGIYSGYLPTFSSIPGYYTLRILASDNNGQAFTFTDGAPIPTGSFKRILSAPSFHVGAGAEKGRDVAPPSRVTDLQLVNSTGLSLTLTWSAAGGDYDIGRSARVELRCHTSHLALSQLNFTKQGILVPFPEDVHPLTHGLLQTINARIPWTNEVFYYGLVSYDEAGNMAEVSNLVEVFIEEITTKSEEANLTLADLQLNLGESSWLLDKTKIYIIGGVVAGVILVIVLLVTCLIVRAKRLARAKTRWVQDTYEAGFSPEVRVEKVETESGIYSWLESLPRSEKKEEEGSSSSSSRPTTSTDDSISDSGDPQHGQHNHHQLAPAHQPTPGLSADLSDGRHLTANTENGPNSDYQIYVKSFLGEPTQRLSSAESALMGRLTGQADQSPYSPYMRSPYHNFHRPPEAGQNIRSASGNQQAQLRVEPVLDMAAERKRRHESVV